VAIHQADGTSFIKRYDYGTFPSNTVDWTIGIQFKYTNTPTGFVTIIDLFKTSGGSENFYLGNGTSNVSNVFIEVKNAAGTDVTTAAQAITLNTWNSAYVTYNSTSHLLSLYVNGSLTGTATLDLSASIWSGLQVLGTGSSSPDLSVAYLRAWSNILTSGEMTAEIASITAVKQTGLLFDCPLQASIDLTSHNNTLNQLVAVGTVTTDTGDPLLSIVASPPSNITPGTATVVSTTSAVFQDTLTGTTATTVWHVCTAPVGAKVMGACCFGDLVTYKPSITVYEGLVNANANAPLLSNVANLPVQFPVTVGTDYYFKSTRNAAVTPATLKLSILVGLTLTIPSGSLAIPDITDGFPLTFLDATATGYPINWQTFPPGEEVGILLTGDVLVQDSNIHAVKLYDNLGSTLKATPAVTTRFDIVGSNQVSYVVADGFAGADQFVLVDSTGVVSTTTYSIGAGGLHAITLSPDSSIAYIEQNVSSTTQPVKQFVLATTTLSTFVAGIASYILSPNLIGLQDGTVLVGYNRVGIDAKVLRYNANGTTANTYDLSADDQIERIAPDNNNALVDFWVWSQPDNQYSRFYKIKISDGTHLTTISNVQKYNDGQYQVGASVLNTPVRFGNSFSCPLWIVLGGTTPANPGGGIYLLTGTSTPNPRQNHDTIWVDSGVGTTENLKIPDPSATSYLAGDE
jgi:hypothetical protein